MSQIAGQGLVVALTGGIASGKTAVSKLFDKLGIDVIDTDVIARNLVSPESNGLKLIVESFGPEILDAEGQLDRKKLRSLIFSNSSKRRQLEAILHPMIWTNAKNRVRASVTPYSIVVVPLLTPENRPKWVNRVLVIDTSERSQLKRLMARDQVSESEALATIQAQMDRSTRLSFADDVIENCGDIEELQPQVFRLHLKYKSLSREKRQSTRR